MAELWVKACLFLNKFDTEYGRNPEPLAINTTYSGPLCTTIHVYWSLVLNGSSYRDPLDLTDH